MRNNKSILLIEDDMVDAMTIKKVLKKLNVERPLDLCKNGEEGLAFLNAHSQELPGLILLDLNMPKMNGLEFLEKVKSHPKFKLIPVVVLTTSDDHNDKLETYKYSVAGYMLKSFDYDRFIEVMRSLKDYWDVSELSY